MVVLLEVVHFTSTVPEVLVRPDVRVVTAPVVGVRESFTVAPEIALPLLSVTVTLARKTMVSPAVNELIGANDVVCLLVYLPVSREAICELD